MKPIRFVSWILVVGILLIFSLSSIGWDNQGGKEAPLVSETPKGKTVIPPLTDGQQKKSTTPVSMPVYKPPLRGAPGGRIGGGTRGLKDAITLFVLAPNHVGLTVQEQPTLYWYLSKPTSYRIIIKIVENQTQSPIFEKQSNPPAQPGVQPIRLADYKVHLSPHTEYRWSVTAAPDPDDRSKDIRAGGLIERIEIPESVRSKLGQAEKGEIPQIYAEAGIWYDALMAISDLIDARPEDGVLRKQRSGLLEQVGLSEVAE
jgi:hypothetical protein